MKIMQARPAIERKFDTTTSLYLRQEDETPSLSVHLVGSYKLDLLKTAALLGGMMVGSALALLSMRRKAKRDGAEPQG